MFPWIFFIIYQIVTIGCLPLIIAILCMTIPRPYIRHRWGFIPRNTSSRTWWFHAASVGEVLSLEYLLKEIEIQNPSIHIILTVQTTTGFNAARTRIPSANVYYAPYDFIFSILHAYYAIKPEKLFIVERELWPNLIMIGKLLSVHIISLNTKPLKKRSSLIATCMYRQFDHFYTQHGNISEQLVSQLALTQDKITTMGNLKAFNVAHKKNSCPAAYLIKDDLHYPVVLVGSLHHGEIDIHLKTFIQLKQHSPQAKLILAPRYLTWLQPLHEILQFHNLSTTTLTLLKNSTDHNPFNHHDVLIIDQMGELFNWYQHAHIFVLGGTFIPIGGHNILEPAVWNLPMIVGPFHTASLYEINHLENLKILYKTHTQSDLLACYISLINHNNPSLFQAGSQWILDESQKIRNTIKQSFF